MIGFSAILQDSGFSGALLDGQFFKKKNLNILGRFCIDN